jgi:hypothetical protein
LPALWWFLYRSATKSLPPAQRRAGTGLTKFFHALILDYERKAGTVMSVTSPELLAAEALADALGAALANPEYAEVAARMLARFGGADAPVVPLREAAHELGISLPTARAWIQRGVLIEGRPSPRAVTITSLAAALAARRAGESTSEPRPLAGLLDRLRDERLLAQARAVGAVAAADDFITYSEGDLVDLEEL